MSVNALLPTPRRLDLLIVLLIKCYLLADAFNGFLLLRFGTSFSLSAGYKSVLLLLMILSLAPAMSKRIAALPVAMLLLLVGPTMSYVSYGVLGGWQTDVGMILKLITPFVALWYGMLLWQRDRELAEQTLHQLYWLSFVVMVVNLIAGRMGYGLSAYLPSDYFPNQLIGSKGFFKATNELSALLLLLSGYLLGYYWLHNRWLYLMVAIAALFCGITLSTKTGMAGVLILIAMVPVLASYLRWQSYNRWLWPVFLLVAALLLLIGWQLPWLLTVLPLSQKLQLVLQQQGVLGLVLSNRDLFVLENWHELTRHFPYWQQLFGIGHSGLTLFSSKPLAEIDPADLFIWFGFAGLLVYICWFAGVIRIAITLWHSKHASLGGALLLTNCLLLLVSLLAGHVMTSGMLWIPWGLFNGMAVMWLMASQAPAAELPPPATTPATPRARTGRFHAKK